MAKMAKPKQKEQTIEEEAGLPENWQPVNVDPIRPGSPSGAPPRPNSMSNYFQGSSAQILQHDTNYLKSDYGSPAIPNNLLIPLGPSGSAAGNSAIRSSSSSAFSSAGGPGTTGGGSGGGSGGGGGSPVPTPVIDVQLFMVNFNPDLLAVGQINGIPA